MSTASPPESSLPESPLIPWRTKESSRHLLMAMVYSLGVASATGLLLLLPLPNPHVTLLALAAHLTSGALAGIFFIPFLLIHLKDGREPLHHLLMPWRLRRRIYAGETHHHRLQGYLLTIGIGLVFLTGLVIALPALAFLAGRPITLLEFIPSEWGGHSGLLSLHRGASILLVVALLLHFPKQRLS
jgi:hypothetical protein